MPLGGHYDRDLADIFAVQDDVTQSIVSYSLGGWKVRRSNVPAKAHHSPKAYDCVFRAKALMDTAGGENSEVVRELLERAIELDPAFGRAHALLAMSYIYEWFRTNSSACLTKAHELAKRAVVLTTKKWCQFSLGFACLHLKRFDEAEIHHSNAVALNPNDSDIAANMGELLTYVADRRRYRVDNRACAPIPSILLPIGTIWRVRTTSPSLSRNGHCNHADAPAVSLARVCIAG